MFLVQKETKSIINEKNGKIIRYSYEDFYKCIVKYHNCFICGANPNSKKFNNEHVIPNWILKSFGTPKSFMILPNGTNILNTRYTIPCCLDCNTLLGKELEIPVSKLLKNDYETVSTILQNDDRLYLKLFHWINLLFFKTHLKDTFLEIDRDIRKERGKIGDTFCWHPLYHIHNIVRQHYTGAKLSKNIQGTVVVFEALIESKEDNFDYFDNYNSQIVMVKVGKIVLLSVLNDSRITLSCYRTFLSKITGALTSVQIRELFARFRYLNDNIKIKPRYFTYFSNRTFKMDAKLPKKIEIFEGLQERVSLNKFMHLYIGDIMPLNLPNRDEILSDLEEGRAQYILDENDLFYQHIGYIDKTVD